LKQNYSNLRARKPEKRANFGDMVSGGRDTDRSRRAVSTSPFQPEPPKKQGNPDIVAGTNWEIIPARENPRGGAWPGTGFRPGRRALILAFSPKSARRCSDDVVGERFGWCRFGTGHNLWLYVPETERITLIFERWLCMPLSKTPQNAPSSVESAEYAHELIESLRCMAVDQGHALLAHLLKLVSLEAERLATVQRQETLLPE
jgi:hypothetical protein